MCLVLSAAVCRKEIALLFYFSIGCHFCKKKPRDIHVWKATHWGLHIEMHLAMSPLKKFPCTFSCLLWSTMKQVGGKQWNVRIGVKVQKLNQINGSVNFKRYPRSGGGVDRVSSSDALGSKFEPRSVYKYGFFSLKPKGSKEPGAPLDLWIEWRGRG